MRQVDEHWIAHWLRPRAWCPFCWCVRFANWVECKFDQLADWADGIEGDDDDDCGGCP